MPAELIKGSEVRNALLAELKVEVEKLKAKHGVVPGLVTILIGQNPGLDLLRDAEDQNRPRAGLLRGAGQPGSRRSARPNY